MKNTLKKIVCFVLMACMLTSVAAILGSCGDDFTPVATYTDPDVYGTTVKGGSVTTVANSGATAGSVSTDVYAGIAGKDYTDTKVYTYNDYISATTGLNWNPLSWETNEDSYVLSYITMGFYDFALNANRTGYSIVCEMAAELPVDVTADYVGEYGIKEGDTAMAWKIALNKNATWQNGDKITADDYIYSMQQQLDPLALYRRADSFYAGDFQLYNAKNYLYQGQTVWADAGADGLEISALSADFKINGNTAEIALKDALDWLSGYDLTTYVETYGDQYFNMTAWASLSALANENGRVTITADSLALLGQVISTDAWGETADYAINYIVYESTYPALSWDEVGLIKLDDYTIVFISTAPTAQAEFYVPYNLSSTWLVHKATFEACKTYYDKDGNKLTRTGDAVPTGAAKVENTYCTKKENTMSYGPYVLDKFQADKEIVFTRNTNWYGYSDNKHLGQFQTDNIHAAVIDKHETALTTFLAGDIDGIGLTADDMATYISSERIRYTPESYTTKLTFNTNYESLVKLGNNQQLLAVAEFRQAFALSINREEFATSHTSAGEAGYGLLNYMYCYDPFSGALYRDSDHAKKALVELFGLTYGEGGDYATLDAAYDAITGYDLDAAKTLMQEAYDEAVQEGIYDGKSKVKLEFTVYQSDDVYEKMFNYFNAAIKEACVGTDFEGKVELTMKVDADYYTTMYSGGAAMIFSTWGGAAMSPFIMINQCYTDASDGSGNQMEYGYVTDDIRVSIDVTKLDGTTETITASLTDWADWCGSATVSALEDKLGLFTDYDYDTRCAFFSIVEKVYLQGYATTSLYYRNVASLTSYKVETGTNDYLQIIGTGGIRHITYNYDDAAWATVKSTVSYTSSSAAE